MRYAGSQPSHDGTRTHGRMHDGYSCRFTNDKAVMSHLVYPNLARLGNQFSQDLNYTGITLEDLSDPVNFIPLILFPLCCLLNGLPNGFQAWWALINFALIHPMDL